MFSKKVLNIEIIIATRRLDWVFTRSTWMQRQAGHTFIINVAPPTSPYLDNTTR